MAKVETEKGTAYQGSYSQDKTLTKEEAEALCSQANEKAEALDIKTRYVVKDD
jgi:hypothetical protein